MPADTHNPQQSPFASDKGGSRSRFPDPPPAKVNLTPELFYDIDGVSYFSPADLPSTTLTLPHDLLPPFSPITVIRLPRDGLRPPELVDRLDQYLAEDDVVTRAHLHTVLLLGHRDTELILMSAWLTALHLNFAVQTALFAPDMIVPHDVPLGMKLASVDITETTLPEGPYLAHFKNATGKLDLLPIYRVHSDTYRAFLYGVYPVGDGTYRALRAVDDQGYNLVPVPSRMGHPRGKDGVSGQRIGVKDVFDVAGLTTAAGNRAYGELTGLAKSTAPAISRLVELGGVLVGKTKTSAFAWGPDTNDKVLDEQYPFSPRADGWQTCGSSSSGSACAMAAYDWLDVALGTDTGGSIRSPAAKGGLYGNRPSTGAIMLDGVLPLFPIHDAAGLLARHPTTWTSFSRGWLGPSSVELLPARDLPSVVLTDPRYLKQQTPEAAKAVSAWLERLRVALGIEVKEVDLDDLLEKRGWTRSRLKELDDRAWTAANWWQHKHLVKGFIERYRDLHGGRWPNADSMVRNNVFDPKETFDETRYEHYQADMAEVGAIINDGLMGAHVPDGSTAIFLYDAGRGGLPFYREAPLNEDLELEKETSTPPQMLSPLARCPDYIIPISQVPFLSKVSKVEEQKTVTISLMAKRGHDLSLLDFVDKLAEKGLIGEVKTGRTAF